MPFRGKGPAWKESYAGNSLTELTAVIKAMVPMRSLRENGPEVALPKHSKCIRVLPQVRGLSRDRYGEGTTAGFQTIEWALSRYRPNIFCAKVCTFC